jgi:hypothetical protein
MIDAGLADRPLELHIGDIFTDRFAVLFRQAL